MHIALSDHFTYKKIIKMTYAPILMVVFVSLYSVVDGICIANLAGHDAFAGVNLIYPITMIVGGFGFMFGAGGAALTSMRLGEKNTLKANQTFTDVVLGTLIVGVILSLIGFFLIEPIANALGSITKGTTQGMVNEAIKYGRILMICQFAFMLQNLFQEYFIVAEKPVIGFLFAIAAGVINIIFDLLLIGPAHMGVVGAAIGTCLGFFVGCIGPILYFYFSKKSTIHFVKPTWDLKSIGRSAYNGSSEFINNVATSIISVVFNIQLLKYYGQIGVEAYGIIMYVILIFIGIFIGYLAGIAPAISYHYGAKNKEEMHNLFKKSVIIISVVSIAMIVLGESLAYPIACIFSGGDKDLIALTTIAMRIWSIAFAFCGFSMFTSSFFTALNDGFRSALASFMRTLVLQISCVLIFPIFMQGIGIWWSIVFSEIITFCFCLFLIIKCRKRYQY